MASINWGDGTSTSASVVAQTGGGFAVEGGHSYAHDGQFAGAVTINDGGGAASASFAAAVDPSAPVITTLVGAPTNGSPIEVKGTGEPGDVVNLYADGGSMSLGTGTVGSNGSFDITTSTTFEDGSHTLTAAQTNKQGVTSTPSTSFSVAVEPSPPMISTLVGQPVNGSAIEVKGTGEAGDALTLYTDGGTTPVGTGTVATDGSFDIITSVGFVHGSHTLMATQTDTQGLTSPASASFAVEVDPTAPCDFIGNGVSDVLLQNGGTVVDWLMNNGQYQSGNVLTTAAAGWNVVGTGDYNGDGTSDVLLQNGGTVVDWIMKNGAYQSANVIRVKTH